MNQTQAASSIGQALRLTLAVLTAGILLWSVLWVATRPLRISPGSNAQIVLRIMHWAGGAGPLEDQIVADLLRRFEAEHPHIRIERINPGDAASFYTKLQTMMAAGVAPDVFYMGYERLGSFCKPGLLLPLEPLIAEDRAAGRSTLVLDDFFPATVAAFRFDGTANGSGPLYGIPKDFTTIGFYYNKTLFQQAHLPEPADDWTWDEFAATARRLAELPGITGAEFVTWPAMLRTYLHTYGAEIATSDLRTSLLREPATMRALEQIISWRFQEDRTLTSGRSQVAQGESAFLTGSVGMAGPFGRWVVPQYRKIDDFEWDFAPLPRGTQRANTVLTVSWSIARQSEHPEAAWELVKFLCGADGQDQAARLGLAIPTLRAVAYSDAFIDPTQPPFRDTAFLSQAEYAEPLPWPVNPQFESSLQNRLDEALRTGGVTLTQAISRLEDEWLRQQAKPLHRTDLQPMPWRKLALGITLPVVLLAVMATVIWWRRRPGPAGMREELWGYALVSPWVLGFTLFLLGPIVLSLLLAYSAWSGLTPLTEARWLAWGNFAEAWHDPKFWISLRVTGYYALLAVPMGQLLALGAAVLMNNEVRLSGFFRSAWYLPSVLAGVGVAILWRWVFDGDFGLLNQYLGPPLAWLDARLTDVLGAQTVLNAEGVATVVPRVRAPQWLDKDAAWFGPPAFALMSFWTLGGTMVIYLAGLKGIPQELYEAASIDGATRASRFRNVTLPMLSPVIFFNTIMAIIGSFQVFTQAYIMTGGGPGDATLFYVLYLYQSAFVHHEMGYASALAWVLLLIILGLTLLVMRGSRRFVYYEALK